MEKGVTKSEAKVGDFWYAYRGYTTCSIDAWGDVSCTNDHLSEHQYKVVKLTPKGVKLNINGVEVFVGHDTRKKAACSTRKEALEVFIAKKKRHISILNSQLSTVNSYKRIAEYKLQEIKKYDMLEDGWIRHETGENKPDLSIDTYVNVHYVNGSQVTMKVRDIYWFNVDFYKIHEQPVKSL